MSQGPERSDRSAPLLVGWERLTTSLMADVRRLPASFRHNLAQYINRELLDGLVLLSGLSYLPSPQRLSALERLDRHLATLKVLLRQAHMQGALSHGQYDVYVQQTFELGRMLGGWQKHLQAQRKTNPHAHPIQDSAGRGER